MAGLGAENGAVSSQPAVVVVDNKTLADFELTKKPKKKKFAFACAILASLTSILLGYGKLSFLKRFYFYSLFTNRKVDPKKWDFTDILYLKEF